MNIGKKIQKRAISLVLALMMVVSCTLNSTALANTLVVDSGVVDTGFKTMLASTSSDSINLGAAQGYNLVCFGDFQNGQTDIEGKSAIGGSVDAKKGFTFGNGSSQRPITSGYGLVWGGTDYSDFTMNANSASANAKALVYDGTLSDFKKDHNKLFNQYETWKDSGDESLEAKCGFTFSDLQDQLINLSDKISGSSAIGVTSANANTSGELVFTGKDAKSNVFTVDAEVLKNYAAIRLVTPDTSTDIINVVGEDVTLPLVNGKDGSNLDGQNGGAGQYKLTHLLWNLSTATTVCNYSASTPVKGSVLAPQAAFNAKGSVFEGTLIVDSLETGTANFEGHNYPFSGEIPQDSHGSADLTVDKTSKLTDWNARTYGIDLSVTAQSKIVTTTTPCDITLVLDRSGSMDEEMGTTYTKITGDPDEDNSYYILVNKDYREVTYRENSIFFWHSSGWYYGDLNRVYPAAGGTGLGNKYQFYTQVTSTKMDALKQAAAKFVNSVTENSPDSRIGVVSFATKARIDTSIKINKQTKSLLRVGNPNSKDEIDQAIDNLNADGATYADEGLNQAINLLKDPALYENVTTASPRNKVVIFFTDGEPNHGSGYDQSVANVAINYANTLKGKTYNATVYSIGVFSNLSGDRLTTVEKYMKAVASTSDKYYPVGAASLDDIFQAISDETGGISSATVTDVIDPRFVLTADSITALKKDGAVVTDNANGSQTIKWSDQKIEVKKDKDGNLLPGWTNDDITVKAKDEFIGGNNIPTNASGSGVTYGTNQMITFPEPTVNVKPVFYLGNTATTIFRGETVPDATLVPYTLKNGSTTPVTGDVMYCGKGSTGTFSYLWNNAAAASSAATFPVNQYPEEDTTYTLTATFKPGDASADSNANSTLNGKIYKAEDTKNTIVDGTAEGKYVVTVKTGNLEINKTIIGTAATNQFFTFKIERFAKDDTAYSKVLSTSYEVIYGAGSKTVTNLPQGNYKVTEIPNAAWRYTRKGDMQYKSGNFLGRNANSTFTDNISAAVSNEYTNDKWISGRDSVTNAFTE